jgi:DNA-binding response OmpR family regulator
MTNFSGKILLVEDDPILGEGLVMTLKLEGHQVDWAQSIKAGKALIETNQYELMIMDIGLPDGEGTELCRWVRQKDSLVSILFLTAKTDEETVVKSLDEGGNDFVKKPFSNKELMARIKSIFRTRNPNSQVLKLGAFSLSMDKREFLYDGRPLGLNRRQFDILSFLITKRDQIVTRDQMLQHLDQEGAIYDRTIDSHLSQLRKILKTEAVGKIQILPVYGVGYRLEILE